MKLIPIKNSVLCVRHGKKVEQTVLFGVELNKKNVDLYEVVDFAVDNPDEIPYKIGDVIMSTSTGDELEINGNTFFLFKAEHIMCVVLDENIN